MDKTLYKERRSKGLRGQGDKPILRINDPEYQHPNFYPLNRSQRHRVNPSDPNRTKKRLKRG